MSQGPLSDWDRERLQKYLHEDKDHTRGAAWAIVLGGVGVGAVCAVLTQPWPARGAGGGYGCDDLGPGITVLATVLTIVILAKLLKRRQPPKAPKL